MYIGLNESTTSSEKMSTEKLSSLRNELERTIFKSVRDSSESAFDKTNMYARAKGLPVDPAVLNDILSAMRSSFVSEMTNRLDLVHAIVQAEVLKVLEQENPTSRKKSAKNSTAELPDN